MTVESQIVPSCDWLQVIQNHPGFNWEDADEIDMPIPGCFVEVRAYYLFEQYGHEDGRDVAHWLQAEAELRREFRAFAACVKQREHVEFDTPHIENSAKEEDHPINCRLGSSSSSWSQAESDGLGSCNLLPLIGKIGPMGRTRKIKRLPSDDPRVREGMALADGYTDQVANLTPRQRLAYRNKVLAVLCATGEIIAAADDEDCLVEAVDGSPFKDAEWRLVDGPTTDTPILLTELNQR